jgi:hypothetical protein
MSGKLRHQMESLVPWPEDGGPTIQFPAARFRCTLVAVRPEQVYATRTEPTDVDASPGSAPCDKGADPDSTYGPSTTEVIRWSTEAH